VFIIRVFIFKTSLSPPFMADKGWVRRK